MNQSPQILNGWASAMLILSAYLCVSFDAMEAICGRVDCSSMEEGGMLFPSEDKHDIAEEGKIDDSKEEGHMDNSLPSVQLKTLASVWALKIGMG